MGKVRRDYILKNARSEIEAKNVVLTWINYTPNLVKTQKTLKFLKTAL